VNHLDYNTHHHNKIKIIEESCFFLISYIITSTVLIDRTYCIIGEVIWHELVSTECFRLLGTINSFGVRTDIFFTLPPNLSEAVNHFSNGACLIVFHVVIVTNKYKMIIYHKFEIKK
jgi:hypothetical protein